MPTRNRPDYAVQSCHYFLQQDYEPCELIIVDDGQNSLEGQLPTDRRIRYVRVPFGLTTGAKRNMCCDLARGEFILQWDDDDWHGPRRISLQTAALRAGDAEITGLTTGLFFDLPRWSFWRCTAELHRRMFVEDVNCGTLAFHRKVWEQGARYPDISLGEDVSFLRRVLRSGARLRRVDNEGQFIYLRHGRNTCSFVCGLHIDETEWQRVAEPDCLLKDRGFYALRSQVAPSVPAEHDVLASGAPLPRVSCILFVHDHRELIPLAIRCFQNQTYSNRELLIVEEADGPMGADSIPSDGRIRRIRIDTGGTMGAKRNRACHEATGDFIAHWDAVGWMADRRLHDQVNALLEQGADVCGASNLLYYDVQAELAWNYLFPSGFRFQVAAETLCYSRHFWKRNPFPDSDDAEAQFLWTNVQKVVLRLRETGMCVALRLPHILNTAKRSYSSAAVRSLLGDIVLPEALLSNDNRQSSSQSGGTYRDP
jgi:glycosyltransferase involved in cell wall biosynthesis